MADPAAVPVPPPDAAPLTDEDRLNLQALAERTTDLAAHRESRLARGVLATDARVDQVIQLVADALDASTECSYVGAGQRFQQRARAQAAAERLRALGPADPPRCPTCNDEGRVHSMSGEDRGECPTCAPVPPEGDSGPEAKGWCAPCRRQEHGQDSCTYYFDDQPSACTCPCLTDGTMPTAAAAGSPPEPEAGPEREGWCEPCKRGEHGEDFCVYWPLTGNGECECPCSQDGWDEDEEGPVPGPVRGIPEGPEGDDSGEDVLERLRECEDALWTLHVEQQAGGTPEWSSAKTWAWDGATEYFAHHLRDVQGEHVPPAPPAAGSTPPAARGFVIGQPHLDELIAVWADHRDEAGLDQIIALLVALRDRGYLAAAAPVPLPGDTATADEALADVLQDLEGYHRENATLRARVVQLTEGLREGDDPQPFVLVRHDDETGVSTAHGAKPGERVAWGCEFPDGPTVIRWCVSDVRQTAVFASLADVLAVHGHNGKTEVQYL